MYKFYTWPTPNSYKVSIFLREAGLPYEVILVDISQGEQFSENFLKLTPNNKIPVLVDEAPLGGAPEPLVLFESGCILEYLADKTLKFLEPRGRRERYETLKWLYWQMAGLGPMLGQNHHFSQYAPQKIPYAIDRYMSETRRLYSVLDHQLETSRYVAGDSLSVADFAIYPWIVPHDKQGQRLEEYPALHRWFEETRERPAVVLAYEEGARLREGKTATVTEASRKHLFGQGGEHLKKLKP